MKTVGGIFWHDLKQLVRNPFALLVVVGLIVLPSVYAWYSIEAMWDPYSHIDGLKVAVVNEDAGADTDEGQYSALPDSMKGGKLVIGDKLVEAIGQDDHFDWQLVDAEQGKAGLDSGEYYAELIVPSRFTADFLSVLTGDTQHPTIEYWVNEKYNAVALEVTDAGAGILDALVNRVFTDIAAEATADWAQAAARDVQGAAESQNVRVQSSLANAAANLTSVTKSLRHAGDSIDRWAQAVASAKGTVDSVDAGAPALKASARDAVRLLDDLRTTLHEAGSAYSGAVTTGSEELPDQMRMAGDSIRDIADDLADQQSDMSASLKKSKDALQKVMSLISALEGLGIDSSKLAKIKNEAENLQSQMEDLEDAASGMKEAAGYVADAADDAASDIDLTIKDLEERGESFDAEVLPRLESSYDSIALLLGSLGSSADNLASQAAQAKTLLERLTDLLQQTKGSLEGTIDSVEIAKDSLGSARTDLASLSGSEIIKRVSSFVNVDANSYGSFMSAPVTAAVKPVYSLNSYGAGVAPFYTNLALWVGCFMLIAVLKLEVDPKLFPRMRPWQAYVGRLLLLAVLALLQAVVVTAGDLLLGVQAVGPVSLIVAGLLVSFCFISIVYALAISFKHVGKALAVVFLIIQIPGASGMYPIQLMPEFFQALYPWLPFTYGMGAMREAIGGFYGNAYVYCLLWLFACGLLASVFAIIVRPLLLNLNRLFDRKLQYADVFIAEEFGMGLDVASHRPVVSAALENAESQEVLLGRMRAFASRYTMVKQLAPMLVIILTVSLGVASHVMNLDADGKLMALAAFIVAVVAIFCACVAMEFVYDNMVAELDEAGVDVSGMRADRLAAQEAPVPAIATEPVGSVEPDEARFVDVEYGEGAGLLDNIWDDEPLAEDEQEEDAEEDAEANCEEYGDQEDAEQEADGQEAAEEEGPKGFPEQESPEEEASSEQEPQTDGEAEDDRA